MVDESSLTGESESVGKGLDPIDSDAPLAEGPSRAWVGTAVTNGRARGVVTATEFGRIAQLPPCNVNQRYWENSWESSRSPFSFWQRSPAGSVSSEIVNHERDCTVWVVE